MKKSYRYNGKIYDFVDVHYECGMLYGECTTVPYRGAFAWLDDKGFQICVHPRVEAEEITSDEQHWVVPNGCHYWGGQIRNNAMWRKQW